MNDGILIVGMDGLIGSRLVEMAVQNKVRWFGTCRKSKSQAENIIHLDLLSDEAIRNLSLRPKITYICAAETNIQKCQNDPLATRKINVEQTIKLARHLHEAGSEIVFLSSNLVFDGNQSLVGADATASPVTEYGRQKAEAEKQLLNEMERVAIVRLTKVIHPRFTLFREWASTLGEGRPIHPFSDMSFSPIDIATVAEELWTLSQAFQPGIFQLSGNADISYASAAQLLAQCRAIDERLIKPQTTTHAGYRHYFPKHTALAYKPVRADQEPESVFVTLERTFKALQP